MSHESEIVIVAARRTPIGSFLGALSPLAAPALAASLVRAFLAEDPTLADRLDEAVVGCVLAAGVGQAPARQAVLLGGLPPRVGATTVNKVCGSGMKSLMLAHDLLRARAARLVLAGGMESMSNAPYLLPRARTGWRMGHQQALDHMFFDGLENASDHLSMGVFAEQCAAHYGFSREAQDAYAAASVARARAAEAEGAFAAEIVPLTVRDRKGQETTVRVDEEPTRIDPSKIPTLKPAFRKDGTVTAASSSSISDGAALLLLTRADDARRWGYRPLARVVGHATHSQEPEWFTTAPVGAIRRLVDGLGWRLADVDLFEINEAFATVTMAAMKELDLPHEKVNVHGGACALGHPIGASGARIVVTLLHALARRGARRGVAALCIGGGEATALAIERLD
jgi:acetyl-CoA C-acetyltransferase